MRYPGTRTYATDFPSDGRRTLSGIVFSFGESFGGGMMSNPLNRLEHYRYLANHHRRLASNDSSRETRSYHLYMAENFGALAAAARSDEPMNSD
jgi:hypothetical protein